ncbi:MAG: DNA-deoxyinosine glycosylase [Oscillospiraceae bacterium]|nr:DNA-deoxyinosine glycosylase [Oscillospiraceae bacterium]
MEYSVQVHPFPPLWDAGSRVLILGSFPSVKSREAEFFYAHPQNRFWPLLAALFGAPVPRTREEKAALALSHRLALWDVVGRCEIAGSSDASIRAVEPNDLRPILAGAEIRAIFCNGGASWDYYRRLCREPLGREAVKLPSTSPANARWTLPALTDAWREAIFPYLEA